ncbi:MAG: hypothetical protein HY958_07390 [Bacteroidia bacterium]|nr:hypothetical protein [Bacteroidia bacterium]
MDSKNEIKETREKINEIEELQKKVDSTNELIKEVDSINQVITNLLYTRDNFIIDLQNFSIMSITPFQELNKQSCL